MDAVPTPSTVKAEDSTAPETAPAAKLLFLIGDAPPHLDYGDDATTYAHAARAALAAGVRAHAVAASGLEQTGAAGTLVWRQLAAVARGKFVFIEYGRDAAAAAADGMARHGVRGAVASNNLDAILLREIQAEIDAWRKG